MSTKQEHLNSWCVMYNGAAKEIQRLRIKVQRSWKTGELQEVHEKSSFQFLRMTHTNLKPTNVPGWIISSNKTFSLMIVIGPESGVRSLAMLVSNWLTDWRPFSKLDWCDSGTCRRQLKMCQSCTVVVVNDKNCVNNSLEQTGTVKLVIKLSFVQTSKQVLKVWS